MQNWSVSSEAFLTTVSPTLNPKPLTYCGGPESTEDFLLKTSLLGSDILTSKAILSMGKACLSLSVPKHHTEFRASCKVLSINSIIGEGWVLVAAMVFFVLRKPQCKSEIREALPRNDFTRSPHIPVELAKPEAMESR